MLDAATTCLARDPDASVQGIAREAGVGRVTLYGHFESRAVLVAAVVDRAMRRTNEVLDSLDLTGDPRAALTRLVAATWELTSAHGSLVVAAERALSASDVTEAHTAPMRRVRRLIERGRRAGAFRRDLPVDWQVTLIHTVTHTAAGAVHRGELRPADAPRLINRTLLAALTPPGDPVPPVGD
ncbi:MAG: TetR/AcrR family transcriptional regulator [Nocardioides sp.]